MFKRNPTSWQKVSHWYNDSVGSQGHYYHQHVVLPGVEKLLDLHDGDSLLDLACGQGVLARRIPKSVEYLGIDAAESLIRAAQKMDTNPNHRFRTADATRPLQLDGKFSHAACVLALQNMSAPERAIRNLSQVVEEKGTVVIVLNHPCFRIPRQSSWGVDEKNKLQYRRINRYLSPIKIPIQANPSKGQNSEITWSFHQPLEYFFNQMSKNGLMTQQIEEWTSDKQSEGKSAKMENRGRSEFPLFLAIKARKITL